MSTLNELAEITEVEDTDYLYIRRAADVEEPDKRVAFSNLRPSGIRIESFLSLDGEVTIPDISSTSNWTWTFELVGAREGDFILINWTDGLPGGLLVGALRVSDLDTVEVRMRNSFGTDFTAQTVPLTALLIRAVI